MAVELTILWVRAHKGLATRANPQCQGPRALHSRSCCPVPAAQQAQWGPVPGAHTCFSFNLL